MRPARSVIAVVLLTLWLAACGSSSKSSTNATTKSTAQSPGTTTTASKATTANSGSSGAVAAVTTGPVRATLRGANHNPVVNQHWVYVVTATDASGHSLTGTVDSEFVFGGQVVGRETPPTHPLRNGRLHDFMEFPAASLGVPLTFQTVVHTPQGTVTLDWPVRVRK